MAKAGKYMKIRLRAAKILEKEADRQKVFMIDVIDQMAEKINKKHKHVK